MTSSMKAYLAAKYMSGPKADAILARASTSSQAPKKKKRKIAASSSGANPSFIRDDDASGWGLEVKDPEDDDDGTDAVMASDRAFKKRQKTDEGSGWATVREGEVVPADEQPQVVEEPEEEFKGGLMTAAQLKKKFGKKSVKDDLTADEIAAAQETIYRDTSGRKIDTAVERAEAARKKREREEKEAKKMEWGKGLVQRDEAERKKRELEELKSRPFARTADDAQMNEEMKAQDRWNDPAAAFLTVRGIATSPGLF